MAKEIKYKNYNVIELELKEAYRKIEELYNQLDDAEEVIRNLQNEIRYMNLQIDDNGGGEDEGDVDITRENKEDWEDDDEDNGKNNIGNN